MIKTGLLALTLGLISMVFFSNGVLAAGRTVIAPAFLYTQSLSPLVIPAGGEAAEESSPPRRHGRETMRGDQKGERPPAQGRPPRLEEMREKRAQLRAELEALPPEEREERMKELLQYYSENREARRAAFREEFKKRWDNATDEERSVFCDKAQTRCRDGGAQACDFVSKACGLD